MPITPVLSRTQQKRLRRTEKRRAAAEQAKAGAELRQVKTLIRLGFNPGK